ncbi:MAG: SAVED domain-containing protein [Saprospiraceae bacterium]|nr:SAVED domain-containing protein [Saprospiraceae bacterium]
MSNRKKIPDDIMLKLWVKSGGRCEFPGCNVMVWRDGLTLKEDNFAHMAHIVAASSNGPRGDVVLSPELQIDYDNLLLLCQTHSKLIDGKNKNDYSVEDLVKYKAIHEDRIRRQTELAPEHKTTVVIFQSPIRDRQVVISNAQAFAALYPRYPADDKGIFFDFSTKSGSGDQNFWNEYSREISEQVKHSLRKGNNGQRYEHLSIFGLAPIPALICLGNQVGNIIASDLFQKHRDTDDWKWKQELLLDPFEYQYSFNDGSDKSKVALVLSLSGKIGSKEYRTILGSEVPVFEIEVENAGPEFLMYKSRLEKFRMLYRKTISDIRAKYGGECVIHLFPAIPSPIAVLCGKELLPKADPPVLVYDYDKNQGGFLPTLTIK